MAKIFSYIFCIHQDHFPVSCIHQNLFPLSFSLRYRSINIRSRRRLFRKYILLKIKINWAFFVRKKRPDLTHARYLFEGLIFPAFPVSFLPIGSVAGVRERLRNATITARFGLFCFYNTSPCGRGPAALGRGEVTSAGKGVPKTPQPGFAGAEACQGLVQIKI